MGSQDLRNQLGSVDPMLSGGLSTNYRTVATAGAMSPADYTTGPSLGYSKLNSKGFATTLNDTGKFREYNFDGYIYKNDGAGQKIKQN